MTAAPRHGHTLVELAAGLALVGVVATTLVDLLARHARLALVEARTAEAAEAVRVAELVLEAELRASWAPDDLRTGADTVALRAMRALAVRCGGTDAEPLVRLFALRRPDPDKDSVVSVAGVATAAITGVASLDADAAAGEGCLLHSGAEAFRLRLSRPVGGALLVFERGTYALADSALRYRRGGGGRQPLTPEVFAPAAGLSAAAGAEPGLRALHLRLDNGWLATTPFRITLLNAAAGAAGF